MSDLLKQKWFLLGQPWTHSGDAGFAILAGSEDPHLGKIIADTQDYSDDRHDEVSRDIAAHIVKLHNDSLRPATGAQVADDQVKAFAEAFASAPRDSYYADIRIGLEAAMAQRKA